MTLTSFQQDLKNGMTIHDALCKHGLTFRQAVLGVSRPITEKKPQYPRSRCGENTYTDKVKNTISGKDKTAEP